MRALGGAYQFVQFDLNRFGVAVLGVLNQEHHQKRDDGGSCVDDQLPCVAEVKQRAGDDPNHNQPDGHCEDGWFTRKA